MAPPAPPSSLRSDFHARSPETLGVRENAVFAPRTATAAIIPRSNRGPIARIAFSNENNLSLRARSTRLAVAGIDIQWLAMVAYHDNVVPEYRFPANDTSSHDGAAKPTV